MLEIVRALGVGAVLYHGALSAGARRAAHTAFIHDQACPSRPSRTERPKLPLRAGARPPHARRRKSSWPLLRSGWGSTSPTFAGSCTAVRCAPPSAGPSALR